MTRSTQPRTTRRARRLRREMTEAEALVWNEVRRGQVDCRIRRQEPIGPYVVDFVCRRHRWVFEIDGSQHNESAYDRQRDGWLEAHGFRVMRFWNQEVLSDLEMGRYAMNRGWRPRIRRTG